MAKDRKIESICSECGMPVRAKDYAVRLFGKVIHLECMPAQDELRRRVREFETRPRIARETGASSVKP